MTKDPYVRFWIEDGVEVAMCTAADFREAMNERDRLRAALTEIMQGARSVDYAIHVARVALGGSNGA